MTQAAQRLALGTAQLGLRYGVANRTGQPNRAEAGSILAAARAARVDTVDTAMVYGESEVVLGSLGVAGLRVVTKLAPLPEDTTDVRASILSDLQASLARLRIDSVYGLLLHRPRDALGAHGGALIDVLRALRHDGLVEKIGVSIYDPAELGPLTAALDIDIVQAPFNVFDRRLESSGWLERLTRAGTEVHTRSAFLQGLLLMDAAARPPQFARWQSLWDRWHAWLSELRLSPLAAALGFVLRHPAVTRVVVGVETAAQLRDLVAAAKPLKVDAPAELSCTDLDLIDPSRWQRA